MSDKIEATAPPHDNRAKGARLHPLVRLLAEVIFWAGCVIMAVIVIATVIGLAWILCQPGEVEALLGALGVCSVIMILLSIWLWSYVTRGAPNAKVQGTAPLTPNNNKGENA
jgi:hypothetical protein